MPFGTDAPFLIEAAGLEKVYQRGDEGVVALRNVNLSVLPGEFAVIIGPSGSGKSTLLHLLGGIDRPTHGELYVNGIDLIAASEAALTRFRRDNIGFVFQFYNLLPSLNALDNVILPLLAKGMSWKAARARGADMLAQVGLRSPPEAHSRSAFRRGAAASPSHAPWCSSPASSWPTNQPATWTAPSANSIITLMVELNQRLGVTFIVATHNLNLLHVASRTYEMVDGQVMFAPAG